MQAASKHCSPWESNEQQTANYAHLGPARHADGPMQPGRENTKPQTVVTVKNLDEIRGIAQHGAYGESCKQKRHYLTGAYHARQPEHVADLGHKAPKRNNSNPPA